MKTLNAFAPSPRSRPRVQVSLSLGLLCTTNMAFSQEAPLNGFAGRWGLIHFPMGLSLVVGGHYSPVKSLADFRRLRLIRTDTHLLSQLPRAIRGRVWLALRVSSCPSACPAR